jgi:hypothetical protein
MPIDLVPPPADTSVVTRHQIDLGMPERPVTLTQ